MKTTKKFVKNQLMTGTGLIAGSIVFDKLGGIAGVAGKKIADTGQGALGLASTGMVISGAGNVMDSFDQLTKSTKKKK